MDNLEIGLYRYLVTINAVACALVFYQHLILGLRPTKITPRPSARSAMAPSVLCAITPYGGRRINNRSRVFKLRKLRSTETLRAAYGRKLWHLERPPAAKTNGHGNRAKG